MGFTPGSSCNDATFGTSAFGITTHDPIPGGGIRGAIAPGGCPGAELNQEFTFTYPACTRNLCAPPPNSLRAWIPLDETSGTTVRDISGKLSGTRTGAVSTTGRVGRALDFDGFDDQVSMANDFAYNFGSGDFSIDAWIKTTDTYGTIVSKRLWNTTDAIWQGYSFLVQNSRLVLQMAQYPQGHFNYTSGSLPVVNDGQWHFVAVTVDRDDPNGGKFYLDGALIYTFDPRNRSGNLVTTVPFVLGQAQGDPGAPAFDGLIDEVELFHRALSEAEILRIYNAGTNGKCKNAAVCGGGQCLAAETCSSCPQDCGACLFCGDGLCSAGEMCNCTVDCGSCNICGDAVCTPNENCSSCPMDCGFCCGDEFCDDPPL